MANIAKNIDKNKLVYSDCGVAFDGKGEWNFGNDSAGNVVIFVLMETLVQQKKSLVLILVKQRQNFP